MTRDQKFRYEMLIRVRMYARAHAKMFASSACAAFLAELDAAVDAIDTHHRNHIGALSGTRRMKAWPRAAVFAYMKRMGVAARRVRWAEQPHPFLLPRPRTIAGDLAAARLFLTEGDRHREVLVRAGLPETFVSDFRVIVDRYQESVDGRSRAWANRSEAMSGLADAFRRALDAVRGLDVAIPFATDNDRVAFVSWQAARQISGLRKSTRRRNRDAGEPAS